MESSGEAPLIRTPVTLASRIITSSTLASNRISTPRDCNGRSFTVSDIFVIWCCAISRFARCQKYSDVNAVVMMVVVAAGVEGGGGEGQLWLMSPFALQHHLELLTAALEDSHKAICPEVWLP